MSKDFAVIVEQVKAGLPVLVRESVRMLAVIARLDDVATLRECKAQAAAIYAYVSQRKDGSVGEYNAGVKIKGRVEHRLGEVLAVTVNHKGGRPKKHTQRECVIPVALGTAKQRQNTSTRTQQLAKVPWEEIEKQIDDQTERNEKASLGRIVKGLKKEAARKAAAKGRVSLPAGHEVRTGDFRQVLGDLADGSVSLIFTDPPYDKKSIPLYADLGAPAAH